MRQIYKANKAVTTLSCGWITMTEELSESIQLLLRGREYPTQTRRVIGWLSDLATLIGGGDSPQFPSDFYGFAYPGIEDYKSTDRCWHN